MSDRGSILISTANDIGEALVEKLGGEGYAPSVWDKEYNKLGIAEVDSAPALSVLENSSETGTARGSILMSTANAIGAMLNKKYNTDRGFKPKEWASAGRKMKPLETDTKSGSIVNIHGAKETPLLSLVGTIDPTISGTSEVSAVKLGKNLLNASDNSYTFNVGDNYRFNCGTLHLKKGVTYTFSANQQDALTSNTRNTLCIGVNEVYTYENASATNYHNQSGSHSMQYTPNEDCEAVFLVWVHTPSNAVTYSNFMVEVGSSASTYEPYKNPTTYTADLGRTVYGGAADIVNGTGKTKVYKHTFTGDNLSSVSLNYGTTQEGYTHLYFYTVGIPLAYNPSSNNVISDIGVPWSNSASSSPYPSGECYRVMNTGSGENQRPTVYAYIHNTWSSADDFKAWLNSNPITIVYEVETETDFTFTGQEINTSGDVENYYTSAGDTSIEYYAIPTAYTRGTASGAIANVPSARTDLPFTKVKANIAPSITGTDEVEVYDGGKNILNDSLRGENGSNIFFGHTDGNQYDFSVRLKKGTYTFSVITADGTVTNLYIRNSDTNTAITGFPAYGVLSKTFTLDEDTNLAVWVYKSGYSSVTDVTSAQIEVGSSSAYEPYRAPTTYTAYLGRTVYGGSADIVNGIGSEKYKFFTASDVTGLYWNAKKAEQVDTNHRASFRIALTSGYITANNSLCNELSYSQNIASGSGAYEGYQIIATAGIYFCIDLSDIGMENATSSTPDEDFINAIHNYGDNLKFVVELATQTDFTFAGQVIVPSEGVNNLWNNAGGDTEVEYFTTE